MGADRASTGSGFADAQASARAAAQEAGADAAFKLNDYSGSPVGHYRLGLYYTFANALLLCADRHADIPKDIKEGMIRHAQALKGVIRTILASANQPLPVEPLKFWEVLLEQQKGAFLCRADA